MIFVPVITNKNNNTISSEMTEKREIWYVFCISKTKYHFSMFQFSFRVTECGINDKRQSWDAFRVTTEEEITFTPLIVLCVPVLPPASIFPPRGSFFFQRSLSGWRSPQHHDGISCCDHFQLMSSFISRERLILEELALPAEHTASTCCWFYSCKETQHNHHPQETESIPKVLVQGRHVEK